MKSAIEEATGQNRIKCERHLEMRLKLEVDEATKRYYLHLIVVHAKSNQTKHHETGDNIDC